LTAGVVVLAGIAISAVSGALTNVTTVVSDAITGAAGGGS
jgi:ABC-type Fe3+-siderophore transport system permease subunit